MSGYAVIEAMSVYGGSFAKALASAFRAADNDNARRLKEAFPEMWAEYDEMARIRHANGKGPA